PVGLMPLSTRGRDDVVRDSDMISIRFHAQAAKTPPALQEDGRKARSIVAAAETRSPRPQMWRSAK
ncbi:MAG TPA: hypothetical protein VMA34_20050, partial [Terracidiphilus sp.]|nr:hypothetical protein [Terracidiphilus sp.]